MTGPRIEAMVHRCIVRTGPMAGSKYLREVRPSDIEFGETCEHCGERLAMPEQVLAHIYGELTA